MDFFKGILDSDFMPHGHCYQWLPEIVWLHVLSDGLITISYACIPVLLFWFVRQRKDLAFKSIFVLFGAFILLCGMTHGLEIWAVWHGTYRLTGVVKALTGLISMSTSAALFLLMPRALRLPSPQQLEQANRELERETRERIKAESELAEREKEELFRAIVEAAPNGMFLVDDQKNIALANSTAERLFGFAPGGLHGVALRELIPVADRAAHDELVENFFQNPQSITMARGRELTALGRDGSKIPVEIGLTPLLWSGSTFVLASIVDISERYQQKKMLEEANHRFDRAIAGVADGMWEWTIGEEELWMSDQFFKILGYDPAQFQGSYSFWFERIHPEDQEAVMKQLDAHLEEGISFNNEQRILCEDGEYRWFLSRGDSFIDPKTGKSCMSGFVSDIHRRKMAETRLSEKTQFLNNIYNGIHHGIFVVDVTEDNDFRFAAFNPAEERLTGINFEDIRNKRPEELCPKYLPPEAVREIRANYQRCLDERQEIKYVEMIPFKDRNTWWLTSLTPLMDVNNRIFRLIGSASEITSLKQMEITIRDREEFSRKILDHSLNGLYIFDLVNNLNKYINPAYSRITGYRLEDLHGADLVGFFHPDEVGSVFRHMTEVAVSEDGKSVEIEYRFLHKDGHWIWCLSRDAVFTRDEQGKATEMIGTFIDITDIKNYRHILEQSNRELEQFAFIASHDLREPLRKIKSFGDLLVSRFKNDLPEKGQDYVIRMTGAAERLDLMINDLLAFSRVSQHLNLELTHLNNVLADVLEDLRPRIRESSAFINLAPLPSLMGDPNHYYQLFLNLISNAIKYRRKEVQLEIKLEWVRVGDMARIFVIDNGIGIPEENAEEIFQIFRRLHGRGEYSGSGIGLAICKKIVDRHGGSIWVQARQDGPGACFVVELPLIHSGSVKCQT